MNDCAIRLYHAPVRNPRLAPPIRGSSPEPPSSETRELLVAAAERLFAERGFAGVSVREIAAEAGVNWSLVGYYLRGKDGLLRRSTVVIAATLNAERVRLFGRGAAWRPASSRR